MQNIKGDSLKDCMVLFKKRNWPIWASTVVEYHMIGLLKIMFCGNILHLNVILEPCNVFSSFFRRSGKFWFIR